MRRHNMSWHELRGAEKSWEELWKSKESRDKLRWDEMRWDDLTGEEWWRAEKSLEELSWDELRRMEKLRKAEKRRVQMCWQKMRKAQVAWEEKRTVVISWEGLRKGEKTWDGMRWGEKSWEDLRWVEMGWHRLRWQWDAVSNFQEKLRCDEIRWNERRFNIQKTRHQIDKSRSCCCEAGRAWPSPIGTVFAPLYRLQAFQFWNYCIICITFTTLTVNIILYSICVCVRGHANSWWQMKPNWMDAAGFESEKVRHD